jgi:hypothetical protein
MRIEPADILTSSAAMLPATEPPAPVL